MGIGFLIFRFICKSNDINPKLKTDEAKISPAVFVFITDTTSINTIFQMMFAYKNYPEIRGDFYDTSGDEGPNGIPDILDEIKWVLQWMLKMNPAPGEMYNQIADDRDHIGFRLPTNDPADYGLGDSYRPVYFVTGKPQGLAEFKNTSTGVSSIAGKFASGFALGAELLSESNPELAKQMKQKALYAFDFALSDTGYTQTACNVSPYYCEQTGNTAFAEMEAALRDWLFGCNPWGTAMICGLPGVEDSPMLPHSSYTVLFGGTTPGGLVDDPIDARCHKSQIGIALQKPDEYAAFNNGKAVYHDDISDYATNEPTMDGTARLSFCLASLENDGRKMARKNEKIKDEQRDVIRHFFSKGYQFKSLKP